MQWVVELKVDGVAVSVLYEAGRLVRGVTRGNGQVGDDVTHTLRTRSACRSAYTATIRRSWKFAAKCTSPTTIW